VLPEAQATQKELLAIFKILIPRDFIDNISSDHPNREAQIPVDFYSSNLLSLYVSTLILVDLFLLRV
jgi:hypothetical protein